MKKVTENKCSQIVTSKEGLFVNPNETELILRLLPILSRLSYPDEFRIAKEIAVYIRTTGQDVETVIGRLEMHEPWDYIKGMTTFHGNEFIVDQSVLIPRPETEVLVELAFKSLSESNDGGYFEVIDVGTGSGCVLISLKQMIEEVSGLCDLVRGYIGLDISDEALSVARNNAINIHGEEHGMTFLRSELLSEYTDSDPNSMKLITANLPYISKKELDSLPPSVTNWEPHIALFDENDDGLSLTRALLEDVIRRFPSFILIFELDPAQIRTMEEYLAKITQNETKIEYSSYEDQFGRSRFLKLTKNI